MKGKFGSLLTVALMTLCTLPLLAQTGLGSARVRVAGTVDQLNGDMLVVTERDGQKETVHLSPGAKIFGVEKRQITDIKPGDFVASGGVHGADGKIHAVELRIFPEALRGVGEGQRPWDRRPQGLMTNATVGTVSHTSQGGVVRVTYKGGQSEFIVGPEVPILAYVLAERSLLKPGAAVVTIARKTQDGMSTDRVTAEKDGVKPPL
jgi:hypothetical protein